jgi:hypothetical protein
MTKTITVYTNKVWRVYDEEGYGSYESDGFDPREAWDEQTYSLETTISLALEEITALRKEAEAHQLKLEAHYGVKHRTIPGADHPGRRTTENAAAVVGGHGAHQTFESAGRGTRRMGIG